MQEPHNIAGLRVSLLSKTEVLNTVSSRIKAGQKTWITTLYSEFLYAALHSRKILELLNGADIAVPDGIGILWAKEFLGKPLSFKNYYLKILQSFWQACLSLFSLPFKNLGERIVGREFIWDLTSLAASNNWSIFLLGGLNDVPALAAKKLKNKFPNLLFSYSNKNPDDSTLYDDIKKASPDMLFVAYGPIKQEAWIALELHNLPVKLAIGLGGTFDYLAQKKPLAPKFLAKIGLEWLFRLITQPKRIKRIFKATFGLIYWLIIYKVQITLPFRKNVAAIIMNAKNQIFLGNNKMRNGSDYWQLPQGGLDNNEDETIGAKREAWEETGMTSLKFLFASEQTFNYTWKLGHSKTFQGQSQKFMYFRFLGEENEINLQGLGGSPKEFNEYKWVDLEELPKILHQQRKPQIPIIEQDLKIMREKGIIN